jgi:MATE family multidrug resistance protein
VAFTVLTDAIAGAGVEAGAATSNAYTINADAFEPMIGLNIAVSTLVGQKLGENRPDLAERATWTSLEIGMAYTGLFALLYLAVPGTFLILHATFASGDNFEVVRQTTIILLRFVALYCFFDATQIVLVGALRGAGDTRFILAASGLTAMIFVALGYACQSAFDWHARGIGLWAWWWVMTLWIFALGVIYFLRFLGGKWKSMRVIEPELEEESAPS